MPKTTDDLDTYAAAREARRPGFRKRVDDAEARAQARGELGLKLRRARGSRTQSWVATRMGTTESIVRRIENGADVRLSTLLKFAEALGMQLHVSVR